MTNELFEKVLDVGAELRKLRKLAREEKNEDLISKITNIINEYDVIINEAVDEEQKGTIMNWDCIEDLIKTIDRILEKKRYSSEQHRLEIIAEQNRLKKLLEMHRKGQL